jgi:hypothetical protein
LRALGVLLAHSRTLAGRFADCLHTSTFKRRLKQSVFHRDRPAVLTSLAAGRSSSALGHRG